MGKEDGRIAWRCIGTEAENPRNEKENKITKA
jgi:hypothetical protein